MQIRIKKGEPAKKVRYFRIIMRIVLAIVPNCCILVIESECLMGDIFDVVFAGETNRNVFTSKHMDISEIDDYKAYNTEPNGRNYNERLAIGFAMAGEYE
jgi:hypothetical protein